VTRVPTAISVGRRLVECRGSAVEALNRNVSSPPEASLGRHSFCLVSTRKMTSVMMQKAPGDRGSNPTQGFAAQTKAPGLLT
jgi:hypothetical protein